jgi:Flp pilus assembly protein TadG
MRTTPATRTTRTLFRRRSGTELLELGLVAFPLLLTMIFGTIEFGTYFYVEHNLQAAAREGARAAIVVADDNKEDAAMEAVDKVFENSSLSQLNGFSYDAPDVEWDTDYVYVTVRTTWDRVPQGLRPMLLIRNPQNAELKGYAAMRIENKNAS